MNTELLQEKRQSHTSTESRALSLLGQGIGPEMVASAIGVSVSRISQLLSESEFSKEVLELRYQNLSRHNLRDSKADEIEDVLLEKIKDLIPFMMKPLEVIRAYSLVNGAKRRGSSTPDSIISKQQIVNLVMPTQIINAYSSSYSCTQTNIHNQVIKAGDQELI